MVNLIIIARYMRDTNIGRLAHVGAESFIAQRTELLSRYDAEKAKTADDAVKVDHGNVGEAIIREWLQRFLPKKFGVTKGFIITHDLKYDGPMEEWDVIIYDRLESPVLFAKGAPEKLAIPVEHVRGVMEVKATLTVQHAADVCKKLLKLRPFIGTNADAAYPTFLRDPFVSTTVFFETAVKNGREFTAALDELLPLVESVNFNGALFIRSATHPTDTGYAQLVVVDDDEKSDLFQRLGGSHAVPLQRHPGKGGILSTLGWSANIFSMYLFDLLTDLNGKRRPGYISSMYGISLNTPGSNLFPPEEW